MAKAKQAKKSDDAAKMVTVTLVKSPIGFQKVQGKVVQGMGLRKINHSVTLKDTPETRGMIFKVRHLVTVSEVIMGLNNLKPADRSKFKKKRVGRGPGSGLGKTSGRGHKGAQSRSGYHFKRGFEGGQMPLHRRVPKRGFTNIFRTEYDVVNLDQLESLFEQGATVTVESLRERGIVSSRTALVKVLGRGDVTKALTVQAHKFSGKAAEKLAAAGGKAEAIGS